MKIFFLDQSGQLGGAELALSDLARSYRNNCLVGLLADGPFRQHLERQHIPVQVLATDSLKVRKDSRLLQGLGSLSVLIPLVRKVAQLASAYDLIYANTQKALVVGALASALSRRPLIYHLHDILSSDHFSAINRRLAVELANHFADRAIANSHATQAAFIEAGGREGLTTVVYNGFDLDRYRVSNSAVEEIKRKFRLDKLEGSFVVGHFSRLAPWKGQHLLLEALAQSSDGAIALFVGDCLFGERDYAQSLHQLVKKLNLEKRVRFLGFQSEIVPLMRACDLVVHTSTAPEPFGRVIVEAMLCGRAVVGAASGGAIELIEDGQTGWLFTPGDAQQLAAAIAIVKSQPDRARIVARRAQLQARQRFDLRMTNQQIHQLVDRAIACRSQSLTATKNRLQQ